MSLHSPPPGETSVQQTVLSPSAFAARYAVGPELGAGTFGVVHAGHERATGRPVAIKTYRPVAGEADPAEALWREAALVAQLQALDPFPNLAQIRALVREEEGTGSRYHLVMELVPGLDGLEYVNRLLEDDKSMSPSAFWSVAYQALLAVFLLHCRGVAHRDLKPDNLVVVDMTRDERAAGMGLPPSALSTGLGALAPTPVLLDYGLTCLFDPRSLGARLGPRADALACDRVRRGTLPFMAHYLHDPRMEGASAEDRAAAICAADYVALGITLFMMLEGQEPYDVGAGDRPGLSPHVPFEIADAVQQALLEGLLGADPVNYRGRIPALLRLCRAALASLGHAVELPSGCPA